MKALETRTDLEFLVDTFYEKVKADSLLSPVFAHVDWVTHLPIMYNFWSSLLLGDQSYQGSPFQKHLNLSIDSSHFNQWLELFIETVNENFEGARAEEIKDRAQSIAGVWQFKLSKERV